MGTEMQGIRETRENPSLSAMASPIFGIQLTLGQCRYWGTDHLHSKKNLCITFGFPQIYLHSSLGICGVLVPESMRTPKSMDAQVLYASGSKMHVQNNTWWAPNHGFKICTVFDLWLVESTDLQSIIQRASCMFSEKHLHLSGHTQFKPVLFKGLLYTGVCQCSHFMQ